MECAYAFREYGNTASTPDSVVENALRESCAGVFYIAAGPDEVSEQYARLCGRYGLELILGYRCDAGDDARALAGSGICKKLALANDEFLEWNGNDEEAQKYLAQADRLGYEWVCTLIHPRIVWDLRKRRLRNVLGDTRIFCLTGYALAGYLYADGQLPYHNDGALHGVNAATKYGLTIPALQSYLRGMRVWIGAGYQKGLDAGSRVYAKHLGFQGVVVGTPFTLHGSLERKMKEFTGSYPRQWGKY